VYTPESDLKEVILCNKMEQYSNFEIPVIVGSKTNDMISSLNIKMMTVIDVNPN